MLGGTFAASVQFLYYLAPRALNIDMRDIPPATHVTPMFHALYVPFQVSIEIEYHHPDDWFAITKFRSLSKATIPHSLDSKLKFQT